MIVSNIIAIAQRELQTYFTTPLAYFIAAIFWSISGWFFVEILIGDRGIIQQIIVSKQMGVDIGSIDAASEFINSFLTILEILSLLVVPILSMGLYTEERRHGTLELLATSPLTNWAVALGKLIAVVLLFTVMIFPTSIYEAIAFSTVKPSFNPLLPILGHLGLILLIASLLSLGMFVSSLTNSTILSAILTYGVIFLMWILELVAINASGWFKDFLLHISVIESYGNLVRGIVNFSDFILFFSYIFIGLFLTTRSISWLRLSRR